ncbi:MAG: hypothetical protein GF308_09420, partial [Candidatus Heimdallarchaeota archaeon]|nr:hypothetical protein [Candidatus Heimdallarchaeota archaeon]
RKVREGAAIALIGMGEKAAEHEGVIEALIEALKDEEGWGVRALAAWALGEMGEKGKKAIEPLRKALKEEKGEKPKFEMALSLARLEGKKESEGIKVIQEMKEKGELEEWQERRYKELDRALEAETKGTEVSGKLNQLSDSVREELDELETTEDLEQVRQGIQELKTSFTKELIGIQEEFQSYKTLEKELRKEQAERERQFEISAEERQFLKRRITDVHELFDQTIKERDFFIDEERKEGLQKQIENLKEEISYVRKRADEKITLKDEFAGFWKAIVVIGFIISIVLTILKIIEAVRK